MMLRRVYGFALFFLASGRGKRPIAPPCPATGAVLRGVARRDMTISTSWRDPLLRGRSEGPGKGQGREKTGTAS